MQHFADFGIIKQQNKLKKKLNEVDGSQLKTVNGVKKRDTLGTEENLYKGIRRRLPQTTDSTNLTNFDTLENIRDTKQLPNSFVNAPDVNDYIKGRKQISRDALKARSVDPLTMPYEKKLDWNAPQSFGSILKGGLKTKPVRASAEESLVDRAKRATRDYERTSTLISPDKRTRMEKFQDDYIKPARQASRLMGNFM